METMLTKEKVLKNTEKYFKTGEKYGFMTDDLMETLGQEFIKAPATTSHEYHSAFEGGLIAHLLLVTKYAVSINGILPAEQKVDSKSLIKTCLLSQIGKAKLFIEKDSKWHNDRGIMYEYDNDLTSMSIGERSVFYAVSGGVSFTEEEYQAILNHDKSGANKQVKWFSSTLSTVLKQAIELAIMEEKYKGVKLCDLKA